MMVWRRLICSAGRAHTQEGLRMRMLDRDHIGQDLWCLAYSSAIVVIYMAALHRLL